MRVLLAGLFQHACAGTPRIVAGEIVPCRGTSELCMVGARGFEPPTPASRTQCATGLRYAPTKLTEPQSEGGLSYIRGSKRKP